MAIVYDGDGSCNHAINIQMAKKFRVMAQRGEEVGWVLRQARALIEKMRADHKSKRGFRRSWQGRLTFASENV